MVASLPRYAPGDRVGPYEIVRHLASGGMGQVYAADACATGERVALKVLAQFSPSAAVRFEREVRALRRLEHPNVIAARSHGRTDDGVPFLAMELLRGRDLAVRLRDDGPLPAAEAVEIARQVCAALAAAHAVGVVHRDVKPANVFLCDDAAPGARVRVLDFGIARIADARRLTGTGTPVGTWEYMSPEQARGDADVDARTDVWAAGVLLFECLTGRTPFRADTQAGTFFRVLFEPPEDLDALRPGLPRSLLATVARALDKSRDSRFQTASDLRDALAAVEHAALVCDSPRSHRGEPAASDTLPTPDDATAERRLASVVFVRAARDVGLLGTVALQLGAAWISLAEGDAMAVFGAERWEGDEPARAARLAAVAGAWAAGVGVATGKAERRLVGVDGAAVESASRLARGNGVALDRATADAVAGVLGLERTADGGAAFAVDGAPAVRGTAAPVARTPFVGRAVETAVLLRAAEKASSERRISAVLVVGAPGTGKSRLRHEAAATWLEREPGARFVLARGDAALRDAPFAALRDALGAADASLAAALDLPSFTRADPVTALDLARSALESALQTLSASSAGLVLAVDDAQWLDAPSRAALRWVCEQSPDLPLAIWLFARPEAREIATDAAPGAAVIDLGALGRADAELLLHGVTGVLPPGAADALLQRAGGHPLFLEALGRLWMERGGEASVDGDDLPVSIEGALLAQIDALAPDAREYLKRAAVFGRSFWDEAVGALGAEPAALARVRRAGLVVASAVSRVPKAREFAFRSGLTRDVAYGLWPEAQRARMHLGAAEWLEAHAGAAPDEIARHWDSAGDPTRAAGWYATAAQVSARVADAATTRAHAARALAASTDPAVRWRALVAQDDALQLGADREAQRAGLTALDALAASLGDEQRAEAAWRRCYFSRLASDGDDAATAGERAVSLSDALGDARWGAAARVELAHLAAQRGDFDAAHAAAAAARTLAARARDPWLEARTLATEAYVAIAAGDRVAALDAYGRAAVGFARVGDRRRESLVLANAGAVMLDLGRIEEAAAQLEAAAVSSRRVGNARTAAVATHNLGVARRLLGDRAAAIETQDRAASLSSTAGLRHSLLASAIATERVYLALGASGTPPDLTALAAAALAAGEATGTPAARAAAHAAALRAAARTGSDAAGPLGSAARTLLSNLEDRASRADLFAALYECAGGGASDLAAARAALADLCATLPSQEDRSALRAAFRGRYFADSTTSDTA